MKRENDNSSNELEGVRIITSQPDSPFSQWAAKHGADVSGAAAFAQAQAEAPKIQVRFCGAKTEAKECTCAICGAEMMLKPPAALFLADTDKPVCAGCGHKYGPARDRDSDAWLDYETYLDLTRDFSLAIKWNVVASNDPCAICRTRTDPGHGPELFIEGTWALVCYTCGWKWAPQLMEALEVLHGGSHDGWRDREDKRVNWKYWPKVEAWKDSLYGDSKPRAGKPETEDNQTVLS